MGTVINKDRYSGVDFFNKIKFIPRKIGIYNSLFFSRYYDLIATSFSARTLESIFKTIYYELDEKDYFRAIFDTTLIDSIIFSINNPEITVHVTTSLVKLWKKFNNQSSTSADRTTITGNILRLRPVISFVLAYRVGLTNSYEDFENFIEYYYLCRQLADDISDYEIDSKSKKLTFVTGNGLSKSKILFKELCNRLSQFQLPKFYGRLITLYNQFYFSKL